MTDLNAEALEPCPFCGEPPVADNRSIWCASAACWGPDVSQYENLADAAAAWNRRALPPPSGKEGEVVERLEHARHYTQDEQIALVALAHHIISPDKNEFTGEHARLVLDRLTRYEAPAREAAALITALVAERDGARRESNQWLQGLAEVIKQVPLKDTVKATGTLGDLIDYIKAKIARAEAAEAEAARLRDQVTRLQAALSFWMPGVTEETDTAFERSAGDDAHLLAGFDGDAPKSCWGDVMVEREARLKEALDAIIEDWKQAQVGRPHAVIPEYYHENYGATYAEHARRARMASET